MARRFSLLIALLVLSGCASELVVTEDGALAVIPHRTDDNGHIVVEVMLNGHGPFRFALDTGASISVVYDRAAEAASVEALPGKRVHVLGMTGSGIFPLAEVGKISVGSESWENARVALLPLDSGFSSRLDGLLGTDFLGRYAVWFSQKERALRLYPSELVAARSYGGWSVIRLSPMRVGSGDVRVFVMQMSIEGQRIITLFDLGATVNLMNRRAARALDIVTRSRRDKSDVYGVTGQIPILAEVHVWALDIDFHTWRHRTFLVGDFPIFDVIDIRKSPLAIVGTGFFKERDFIIDFARERLLVRNR